MKREISGTSVATAVLLAAAAVLLCSRLQGFDAHAIGLPIAAALAIEAASYAGIIYFWCRRIRPLALVVGIPILFVLRIAISTGALICAELDSAHRLHLGVGLISPPSLSWLTAVAFAVIALYLVRGSLWQPAAESESAAKGGAARQKRGGKDRPAAQPTVTKVAFDTSTPTAVSLAEGPATAARSLGDDGDVFRVLEPTARNAQPAAPLIQPMPQIEGWVTVPAAVVAEQLPAGAEVNAAELLVPLALVVPRLREGEVRLPLSALEDVTVSMGAADGEVSVDLPLRLIVPQLPDELLELPEAHPPPWLVADAALEDVFFAKV
jgi:hypothetical protein